METDLEQIVSQRKLDMQADAVLYYFQLMDIDMINDLLQGHRTYQDFQKPVFINKLSSAFDEFTNAGDVFLKKLDGFCNHKDCHHKSKGFRFIGNNSMNYFDLIFVINNGIVEDIFECSVFKCVACEENIQSRIKINTHPSFL